MDWTKAWSKIGSTAKTARRFSAERTNITLDSLAPLAAPVAARWDREADRRKTLRTPENLKALIEAQRSNTSARSTLATAKGQRRAARAASNNPLSAERRAARTADRAATSHAKVARTKLREARRAYPATLTALAVRAHALHTLPGVAASYALSTPADWTLWPGITSAGLIAAHIGTLALGRREAVVQLDDGLSGEERRLMARLDPSYWVQHAEVRGLSGTLTERPEMTPAGIVCGVRLDGRWSAKKLAAETESVRALLGMQTKTRMEIGRGSHGDRALITVRTRSASDGLDLNGWAPGDAWAVDTVNGETVPVPLGKRILIAGTSGSGKSTSARPLLAEASERPDHRLVLLDRKYVEGRTWEHRARVACELEDIRDVVRELIAEGEERLRDLPRGEDTVQISPARPRITVFVDEMGELLSDCAAKYRDDDGKSADYQDVIAGLRTIARKYRAAEIILVPATQKPTLSGDGHGLDSQIAGQLTVRLALAVATSTETQSVFGPDAIEKGWRAHELPMPWVALMRDQDKGPSQRTNPIRMRWMTAQQVIALPARPIWQRTAVAPARVEAAPTGRPTLTLVKSGPDAGTEAAPAVPEPRTTPAGTTNRDRVLSAIRDGARTAKDVGTVTGINKGTVSREIKALVKAGAVVRDEDGTLSASAGEVSA
ncbi:FtsK/SpoIIIE domain-containing protein [Streptomyces sp. NPDC020875]|uniref:FtsK/SpoIIIE domain-containing protein n=1 Tax=Streptomyces sp. NPDC020875 TaxID=3154898 RepID=UPI0034057F76